VAGDILPVQIIESRRLEGEDDIWLRELSGDLDGERLGKLLEQSRAMPAGAPFSAYIYMVLKANPEGLREEQLLPGSFEHTLNYLIDRLDPSAFDAAFHNDRKGAPAYPLDVMLKIIFYCYSRGIITSHPVEHACKTNITIKAPARDAEPDHATIADFIPGRAEAVKELFSQILL
jgi:hypothetical protein